MTSLAMSGLRTLEGRPLATRLTRVWGDLAGTEKVTQKSVLHDRPVAGGPRMGRLVPRGPRTRNAQPALRRSVHLSLSQAPDTACGWQGHQKGQTLG